MSCKSAIYTANAATQAVAIGGTLALGSIIRRFGCSVNLNGNGITLSEPGYYNVDASIVVAPTAAGTVTVTLFQDGVAVPGAVASATTTAAADAVTLNIPALVRVMCTSNSILTLVLTGAASSVTNVAVVAEKI